MTGHIPPTFCHCGAELPRNRKAVAVCVTCRAKAARKVKVCERAGCLATFVPRGPQRFCEDHACQATVNGRRPKRLGGDYTISGSALSLKLYEAMKREEARCSA